MCRHGLADTHSVEVGEGDSVEDLFGDWEEVVELVDIGGDRDQQGPGGYVNSDETHPLVCVQKPRVIDDSSVLIEHGSLRHRCVDLDGGKPGDLHRGRRPEVDVFELVQLVEDLVRGEMEPEAVNGYASIGSGALSNAACAEVL